jgi:hypothetical protein
MFLYYFDCIIDTLFSKIFFIINLYNKLKVFLPPFTAAFPPWTAGRREINAMAGNCGVCCEATGPAFRKKINTLAFP